MNQETIERAARAVADAVKISIRPGGETMRLLDKGHTFHLNPDEARTAARAVIAAIHPTVTSEAERDALPVGSVIRSDREGSYVFERLADGWYTPALEDRMNYPLLPATVLHMGGAA